MFVSSADSAATCEADPAGNALYDDQLINFIIYEPINIL